MVDVIIAVLAFFSIVMTGWKVQQGFENQISKAEIIEIDKQSYQCNPVKVTTIIEETK